MTYTYALKNHKLINDLESLSSFWWEVFAGIEEVVSQVLKTLDNNF